MGFFARIVLFFRIMYRRWHETRALVREVRNNEGRYGDEILLPLMLDIDKMTLPETPELLSAINKLGRPLGCLLHSGGRNRSGQVWNYATIIFANGYLAETFILKIADDDKVHLMTSFTTPDGGGCGHQEIPVLQAA